MVGHLRGGAYRTPGGPLSTVGTYSSSWILPSRDRHRARLPRVLMLVPLRFISATASAAFPLISWVLAQDNGASSVEENTTLGSLVSSAMAPSSAVSSESDASDALANPYI